MKTVIGTILITLAMLAVMAIGNVALSSAGASFGRPPGNGEFRPHRDGGEGREGRGFGGGEMLGSIILTTVITAGTVQLVNLSRRRAKATRR